VRRLAALGLVAGALALVGCGVGGDEPAADEAAAPVAADPYLCDGDVAVMAPYGGFGATDSVQMNWARVALDKFNETYDTSFTLKPFNVDFDVEQGRAVAQRIIADQDVIGIVGPKTSGVTREVGPLFDGAGLGRWQATEFGGEGDVDVAAGAIRIGAGSPLSGITWRGDFPRQRFEVELEARRVEGRDFFCGLTFPVADDHCSLILGGWGGGVVGLSCINGEDAANNATTKVMSFEQGRWYTIRVRVTPERIECFLDGERIVDQPLEDVTLSVRAEVVASQPLGIATYATTAESRRVRWRPVGAAAP